jgi:hypothetical protein
MAHYPAAAPAVDRSQRAIGLARVLVLQIRPFGV